ncbi:hypothetical protein BAY06_03975 [Elizabethkingia anophelis]|uniref:hypothetical protein n=1 Tax=Elizabethkingia anophelis TaxID=1117645 RepID=UPI00099AF85B|nr:hypothetical protein [Elizabethkingia anophelis]OPC51495.1 hypothetical protein BAY06_03975 [Elizabethkingia anophelis]
MENNLENKAKFFAQYWGQQALKSDRYGLELVLYYFNPGQSNVDGMEGLNYHLELKSLEDITDEDALHIATSMYTAISNFQTISNGKCMVSCHKNQIGLGLLQSDYLRSKGYALPWMRLSVDDLIKYGWVKLKKVDNETVV